MTLYRATGRTIWTVKVPNIAGEWIAYTTSTRHQATARRIERMIEAIGPRGERAWDLLDMIHRREKTPAELYDVYVRARFTITTLRPLLTQPDLAPLVDKFLAAAHCTPDTKAHYKALLRRLVPAEAAFPAERWTTAALQQAIDEMDAGAATKRKAGAAIRTFGNWLIRRGVRGRRRGIGRLGKRRR